jgi:Acyl-CoA carboxylase epsilon subunit
MSEANNSARVSEDTNGAGHEHVDIHIERGKPTDEEVAALVAVLGGAVGATPAPAVTERNLWGHPVEKLRYAIFSWHRVTLLERTYMRR